MSRPELAPSQRWTDVVGDTPTPVIARLTGIGRGNLSAYRSGAKTISPALARRLAVAAASGEDGTVHRDSLVSVARTARRLARAQGPIARLRLLKQLHQHSLEPMSDIDRAAFYLPPPPTGSRQWDAALAGVADHSAGGAGALPGRWSMARRLFLDAPWRPLEPGEGSPVPYRDVPISLRERNVWIPRRELVKF